MGLTPSVNVSTLNKNPQPWFVAGGKRTGTVEDPRWLFKGRCTVGQVTKDPSQPMLQWFQNDVNCINHRYRYGSRSFLHVGWLAIHIEQKQLTKVVNCITKFLTQTHPPENGCFQKCGYPKWMVYRENPIKINDLVVFPYFWKHPYIRKDNFQKAGGVHFWSSIFLSTCWCI